MYENRQGPISTSKAYPSRGSISSSRGSISSSQGLQGSGSESTRPSTAGRRLSASQGSIPSHNSFQDCHSGSLRRRSSQRSQETLARGSTPVSAQGSWANNCSSAGPLTLDSPERCTRPVSDHAWQPLDSGASNSEGPPQHRRLTKVSPPSSNGPLPPSDGGSMLASHRKSFGSSSGSLSSEKAPSRSTHEPHYWRSKGSRSGTSGSASPEKTTWRSAQDTNHQSSAANVSRAAAVHHDSISCQSVQETILEGSIMKCPGSASIDEAAEHHSGPKRSHQTTEIIQVASAQTFWCPSGQRSSVSSPERALLHETASHPSVRNPRRQSSLALSSESLAVEESLGLRAASLSKLPEEQRAGEGKCRRFSVNSSGPLSLDKSGSFANVQESSFALSGSSSDLLVHSTGHRHSVEGRSRPVPVGINLSSLLTAVVPRLRSFPYNAGDVDPHPQAVIADQTTESSDTDERSSQSEAVVAIGDTWRPALVDKEASESLHAPICRSFTDGSSVGGTLPDNSPGHRDMDETSRRASVIKNLRERLKAIDGVDGGDGDMDNAHQSPHITTDHRALAEASCSTSVIRSWRSASPWHNSRYNKVECEVSDQVQKLRDSSSRGSFTGKRRSRSEPLLQKVDEATSAHRVPESIYGRQSSVASTHALEHLQHCRLAGHGVIEAESDSTQESDGTQDVTCCFPHGASPNTSASNAAQRPLRSSWRSDIQPRLVEVPPKQGSLHFSSRLKPHLPEHSGYSSAAMHGQHRHELVSSGPSPASELSRVESEASAHGPSTPESLPSRQSSTASNDGAAHMPQIPEAVRDNSGEAYDMDSEPTPLRTSTVSQTSTVSLWLKTFLAEPSPRSAQVSRQASIQSQSQQDSVGLLSQAPDVARPAGSASSSRSSDAGRVSAEASPSGSASSRQSSDTGRAEVSARFAQPQGLRSSRRLSGTSGVFTEGALPSSAESHVVPEYGSRRSSNSSAGKLQKQPTPLSSPGPVVSLWVKPYLDESSPRSAAANNSQHEQDSSGSENWEEPEDDLSDHEDSTESAAESPLASQQRSEKPVGSPSELTSSWHHSGVSMDPQDREIEPRFEFHAGATYNGAAYMHAAEIKRLELDAAERKVALGAALEALRRADERHTQELADIRSTVEREVAEELANVLEKRLDASFPVSQAHWRHTLRSQA